MATSLAGLIVERASGLRYDEYVHKNILEPLDMKDTAIFADLSDNKSVKERHGKVKLYDGIGVAITTNQAQEMIFNFKLPELVFGKMSDSPHLEIEGNRAPGLYASTRVAKEGPLSFTQLQVVPHFMKLDGFFLVSAKENGIDKIVMTVMEWHKLPLPKAILFGLVYLFLLITVVYVPIKFLVGFIKRLRKKEPMKSNKLHIFQNVLNLLTVINLAILIIKSFEMLENKYYIVYSAIFLVLLILHVFSLVRYISFLIKNRTEKRENVHGFISILLGIIAVVMIIYFDMYQFWWFM